MKCLIIYRHDYGIGSTECIFNHFPPTVNDVRKAEKEIKIGNDFKQVIIINWLELSDD